MKNGQLKSIHQQLNFLKMNNTLDGDGADRSENLHRLFMYPAMMVPATQYAVIKAVSGGLPKGAWAIDPFMGSGTSLVSCLEFGFYVYGQDINPFAVMLTKAKVEKYNVPKLIKVCHDVLNKIKNDDSDKIEITFNNIDKWFNHDVQIVLSKIRRAIQSVKDSSIRNFLWVVMSEVIRTGSNDRTSTFKLHRRSEDEIQRRKINIFNEFSNLIERGINDIKAFEEKIAKKQRDTKDIYNTATIEVKWGDTKKKIQTDRKFDLLISSPPYGDNHTTVTYGQTSYLPLQWIDSKDLDCQFDCVKTTQEIDRQSLGGKINQKDIEKKIEKIFCKSPILKAFFEKIPEEERKKYYKTLSFIIDFDESLDNIISVMKNDAFYVWTIGNRYVGNREVPNDQILIDLMHSRSIELFERAERQILNKKQPKKNNFSKTMEKEHILIFH